ncbi:MAG TPA: hypothetical protein VFT56_12805 [Sphingomonas sp.]|nr:hypothetical protein [Sphingomonas sp.]
MDINRRVFLTETLMTKRSTPFATPNPASDRRKPGGGWLAA